MSHGDIGLKWDAPFCLGFGECTQRGPLKLRLEQACSEMIDIQIGLDVLTPFEGPNARMFEKTNEGACLFPPPPSTGLGEWELGGPLAPSDQSDLASPHV